MKSDIIFGLKQLAKLTTEKQQYEVAVQLGLSHATARQYLEGKGENEQIARAFLRNLIDRKNCDTLWEIDQQANAVDEKLKYLHEQKEEINAIREMTLSFKQYMGLLLEDLPDGIEGFKIRKLFFLAFNERISDPVVRMQLNNDVVLLFDTAIEIFEKNSQNKPPFNQ